MRAFLLGAALAVLAACGLDPFADLPLKGQALQDAKTRAQQECRIWIESLEAFRQDYGRYPGGREGLAILVRNPDPNAYPDWHGPYGLVNESFLQDPWRRPYHLESTGERLAVISEGPDRQYHTVDDITVSVAVNYDSR
jgi:hypothetical protein